jgi:hypothetical protein
MVIGTMAFEFPTKVVMEAFMQWDSGNACMNVSYTPTKSNTEQVEEVQHDWQAATCGPSSNGLGLVGWRCRCPISLLDK